MGRAIETEASARGHIRAAVFDSGASDINVENAAGAELAYEFTRPSAAEGNVIRSLRAGLPVVCGTTGWTPSEALHAALRDSDGALLLSPNFSVGVNLLFRLTREAGRLFAAARMHQPFVWEAHHRGKRDAPSGTANRLGEILIEEDPRLRETHAGNATEPLAEHVLQVSSVRTGSEPGTHTVGFDGEHDLITLCHRARGRTGFARGAVLGAEWLLGKRGLRAFDEVLDDLLQRGGGAPAG
jgi:4-hydroxy-tetrahydrodipicolinate reductase